MEKVVWRGWGFVDFREVVSFDLMSFLMLLGFGEVLWNGFLVGVWFCFLFYCNWVEIGIGMSMCSLESLFG